MGQKINIPSQNQPFRKQSSLGGDVSFRNLNGTNDNSFITLAKVTKVYYKQGKLDFKLTNTVSVVQEQGGDGSGSAPIPVEFFGRRANGQVFGHYRPVKIGDLIAVAYVNGHRSNPIVIGVYPDSALDYEVISPAMYESGDDNDAKIAETGLAEQKVYPSMQLEYRSGSGTIAKALNGHSFLILDDEVANQYDQLWTDYDSVGFFNNNGQTINPLKEEAGSWLLVHENNPDGDGDDHRTRFYVDKDGNLQIVMMENSSANDVSILEGSREDGFTLSHYQGLSAKKSGDLGQDVYTPDFDTAKQYVTLNLGKDNSVLMDVVDDELTNQSTTFEVKPDGVYLNGNNLSETITQAISDNSKTVADSISKDLTNTDEWKQLGNRIETIGENAEQAGEDAQLAAEDAKQAGLDAIKAGEDSQNSIEDVKNNIIYYASTIPQGDHYIPGKYLAINTDTYIAEGTIKTADIENGAIIQAKIGEEAVGSSQIEDLAVGRAKIAYQAVGTAQIEDLAVNDAKVSHLTFQHMEGEELDASKINVTNINGDNINAGTITANKLIIKGLGDITSNLGKVTSGEIIAGDGINGVDVSGLDADNPDAYTPSKKAILHNIVEAIESSAKASISYGSDVGLDTKDLQAKYNALVNGLAPLWLDMTITTQFDHNTVQELASECNDAINAFQDLANNNLNAKISNTADGKNAVYRGSEQPSSPHVNDIWFKQNADGTSQIMIYTSDSGWINPTDYNVQVVAKQVSSLPQNYYQTNQPTGTDYNDGSHWYQQTGTDSNGNPVYTTYLWNSSTKTWDKMLNSGEVDNANQINQVKSDLSQATSDITQAQSDIKTNASNLSSARSDLQSQVNSAKSDIAQAQSDIKTNANAISDNKGNISSLTSTASKLSSDMTDAQGDISTLQQSATGFKADIADNKGNISSLQTSVNGLSDTVSDNSGDISSLKNTTSGLSNTVADNKGNISTLQTRANSFDISVGQLQTSAAGIQLLTGTATPVSIVGNNTSNQDANTYALAGGMSAYNLYQKYGDTFTLSYDWSVTDTANAYAGMMQQQFNNNPRGIGTGVNISSSNTSGHVVKTFTLANDSANIANGFQFRLDNVPTTSTITVSNMKLEKGSLATSWCLSPMEQLTSTGNYAGLSINDKGLTGVAGSTNVYLSNTHGFEIQKSGSDIFHVDTSGNLTMQGNITAGNISGVNFKGKYLTLAGTLGVTGSISANNGNVVINSSGLNIKGAGLSISDSSGNTTTYIKSDGTFVTNKGVFSGSATITGSLTLSGDSANINVGGGKFYVDSSGNVTANSIHLTGDQKADLSNKAIVEDAYIKGNTLSGNTVVGGTIIGNTINGGTINGTTINGVSINGGDFSSTDYVPHYFSMLSESNSAEYIPSFSINSSGTYRANVSFSSDLSDVGDSKSASGEPKVYLDFGSHGTLCSPPDSASSPIPSNNSITSTSDATNVLSVLTWDINDRGISIADTSNTEENKMIKDNYIPTYLFSVNNLSLLSDPHNAHLILDFDIVSTFSSGISTLYLVLTNQQLSSDTVYNFVDDNDLSNTEVKLHGISGSDLGTYDAVVFPVAKNSIERFMYHLYAKMPFLTNLNTGNPIYVTLLQKGLMASNQGDSDKTWSFQLHKADVAPARGDSYTKSINTDTGYDDILNYGGSVSGFSILPNGTLHFSDSGSGFTSHCNAQYIQFINNYGAFADPYWTTVSAEGIGFSATPSNQTLIRNCIYFSGDNNNSGYSMDSFGNIHAQTDSTIWHIVGTNGQDALTLDFQTGALTTAGMHILPPGADHGIRTAWVSWSNWDNGEKYPAFVQEGSQWGGIAFPKSGRVTLFDDNGYYYSPDKETGSGSYNNYG